MQCNYAGGVLTSMHIEHYAGAARKEHLVPSAYTGQPGEAPFADFASCHDGWAVATISRPNVGTTDGQVLFRTSG